MSEVFAGAGGAYYSGQVGVYRRNGQVSIEFRDKRPLGDNVIKFTFSDKEARHLIELLTSAVGGGELVGIVSAR